MDWTDIPPLSRFHAALKSGSRRTRMIVVSLTFDIFWHRSVPRQGRDASRQMPQLENRRHWGTLMSARLFASNGISAQMPFSVGMATSSRVSSIMASRRARIDSRKLTGARQPPGAGARSPEDCGNCIALPVPGSPS